MPRPCRGIEFRALYNCRIMETLVRQLARFVKTVFSFISDQLASWIKIQICPQNSVCSWRIVVVLVQQSFNIGRSDRMCWSRSLPPGNMTTASIIKQNTSAGRSVSDRSAGSDLSRNSCEPWNWRTKWGLTANSIDADRSLSLDFGYKSSSCYVVMFNILGDKVYGVVNESCGMKLFLDSSSCSLYIKIKIK